jgi:hypothetical protein
MVRVDFEDWEGKEVARIYIAGRVAEALLVEKTLSEHGIDYALDIEPFRIMILGLFLSEDKGVGFYVLSRQAGFSKRAILDAGLQAGIEEDEFD